MPRPLTDRVSPKNPVVPATISLLPPSHAWIHAWVPVEWHGSYSIEKLLGLVAYKSNSLVRVWVVLLLTPTVPLAVCLLREVAIPLNDPSLGWDKNLSFLLRSWSHAWLTSYAVDRLIEFYVPKLRLPWYRLVAMNAVQGAVASAAVAMLVEATRVFPVPFTQTASMPIYAFCSWLLRFACDYRTRQRDPDPQTTQRSFARVMKTINFKIVQIYVYNAFAMAYVWVPDQERPLATLALGLIKTVSTRGEWTRAQVLMESGKNDLSTIHVAFGAQFFHALFTSACLDKSKSLVTLVVLVLGPAVYDAMMIREIQRRAHILNRLSERKHSPPQAEQLRDVARRCLWYTSAHGTSHTSSPLSLSSWCGAVHGNGVATIENMDDTQLGPFVPQEARNLEAVQALFQCREATLLRMYVDMFVPAVFFAYVVVMKVLPNGQYVPFVQTNDLRDLAMRLMVPLAVKIATFSVLLRTLRRTGSEVTGLWQLAFALERMRTVVQACTLFAMLSVVDFSLLHNGNDLTFQFQWLRGQHAVADKAT